MNQNSNIRRIDELGRIVIPKDIRKKMHIKDNEFMEIYIDNETIKIQKFVALDRENNMIEFLIDNCGRIKNNVFFVTNREKIIYSSQKELINCIIPKEYENFILNNVTIKNEKRLFYFKNNIKLDGYFNILPIVTEEHTAGLIIEFSLKNIINTDLIKLSQRIIENSLND